MTQAGNSLRKEALQSPLIVDSLSRRRGENNLPPGPFMTTDIRALYTRLPAIDRLLRDPAFSPLLAQHGHSQVVAQLRQMLDEAREQISQRQTLPDWSHDWLHACEQRLTAGQRSALRPVFNLTGTVLHTNLGRAIQAESAVEAVASAMRAPVTLEYDLDDAGRGHRDRAIADLLCQITGAEDACIVNNNAAAVLLMLAATASGREVVVSRGELVEIGGAFRIPDVMRQAGCQLHEVGTTNRTHAKDYRQAVNDNTALLMKVHTSNYSIEGFTKAVDEAELAAIGRELDIPVVADLGSGSLVDLSQYGLPKEPMPQEMIAAGVSLVSFSGDKLLGGPQAGIIVGKRALIARLQSHPLKRALRADKMTLAALEATLRLYQHPEVLTERLPTLRLLTRPAEEIRRLAERLLPDLAAHYADFAVSVAACQSQIGSGSLPVDRLPSAALTFTPHDGRGSRLEALAARWRALPCPVIGRIDDGRLWLDLRCLEDETRFMEMLLR
ncbi:selenocysteine synthase [Klebsiella variicola]|nr:selenocysteine synthase [Klebsiella variicola]CTQ25557.1 selenocysteine synthase [Klebsiella variicola]